MIDIDQLIKILTSMKKDHKAKCVSLEANINGDIHFLNITSVSPYTDRNRQNHLLICGRK